MKMNRMFEKTLLGFLTLLLAFSATSVAFAQENDDCPRSYDAIGPTDWSYDFAYWVNPGWEPDPAPLPGGVQNGFCFDMMWGVVDAYVDGQAAAAGWKVGYISSTTVVFSAEDVAPGPQGTHWSGFHIVSKPEAIDGAVDWFCDHAAGTGAFDDLKHGPTPPVPTPLIESCSDLGTKKDIFDLTEIVYAKGSGYSPSTNYEICIVTDTTWTDGMLIPSHIVAASVTTTSEGYILTTPIWASPIPGKYDIVVDVDGDGVYDDNGVVKDALDDMDVLLTAGFLVIPEYPLGTILGLAMCMAALAVYKSKRYTLPLLKI